MYGTWNKLNIMCSTQNKEFTRVSGLVTPLSECQQCSSTSALAGKPLRSLFTVVGTKNCPGWVTGGTLGLLSAPFEETTTEGHMVVTLRPSCVPVVAGSVEAQAVPGEPLAFPVELPSSLGLTRSICSMVCSVRTWL